MKKKTYTFALIGITVFLLSAFAATVYYIDPLFHYHAPSPNFDYDLYDERYHNDGVMRNFTYDAMITGTSMTENFKTSDMDNFFHTNAIKVPFFGARYKEIDENIKRAITYNPNLKIVVRGLDYNYFFTDKDEAAYDESSYPTYLTDDSIFDDVYYLFNKTIFFEYVVNTAQTYQKGRSKITSFDTAYNWNDSFEFGKRAILADFERKEKITEPATLTQEEIQGFQANIDQNIVATVKANPDITFYYFFPPYSILYWDGINQSNAMEKQLIGERMVIESLLPYENVHFFSFSNDFDLTTNLDYYKDSTHYGEEINTLLLSRMANDEYRLTADNYERYLHEISEFYTNYDYDAIFQ